MKAEDGGGHCRKRESTVIYPALGARIYAISLSIIASGGPA